MSTDARRAALLELVDRWRQRIAADKREYEALRQFDDWEWQQALGARWRREGECADELEAAISALSPSEAEQEELLDSLHAVFTLHGIASRSDLPAALFGDIVGWAARKCREATKHERDALAARVRDLAGDIPSGKPVRRGDPHRCSWCGARWEHDPSMVLAELCGDCWREAQSVAQAVDIPAAGGEERS